MRFYLVDGEDDDLRPITHADFLSVIKGATIIASEAIDQFLDINTSDGVSFRLELWQGEMTCWLFSDLSPEDLPPIRVQLIADGETPLASEVEARIFSLRQAYAIEYLIAKDVSDDLIEAFKKNPDIDAEATLLPVEDRLYIRSASPGSFWITVTAKSVRAYKLVKGMAAKGLLAVPFEEGRELLMRQLHAQTRIKELEVEQRQLELDLQRSNGMIDIAKKLSEIEDPSARRAVQKRVLGPLYHIPGENRPQLPKPTDTGSGE